jgi:hypothetical protein
LNLIAKQYPEKLPLANGTAVRAIALPHQRAPKSKGEQYNIS